MPLIILLTLSLNEFLTIIMSIITFHYVLGQTGGGLFPVEINLVFLYESFFFHLHHSQMDLKIAALQTVYIDYLRLKLD